MSSSYQVEYQLNGVPSSFEFYLFVNPLGKECYESEQELLRCLNQISSKVDVNILTYHNHQAIHKFLDQINHQNCDLSIKNYYYRMVYRASLAYKAANLQGRKLGRKYLGLLQESFNENITNFKPQTLMEIAKETGLDLEIFKQDLDSDFVRQLFLRDQKIAREMNISQTPTLVIFQNENQGDGIIIREKITKRTILEELDQIVAQYYQSQIKDQALASLSFIKKTK